ncbi:MAG: SemiSWEET family transporter [Burkholderiales bacterium]
MADRRPRGSRRGRLLAAVGRDLGGARVAAIEATAMTMLPADGRAVSRSGDPSSVEGLEKVLRGLSVVTMLMTVPQVLTVWVEASASGVSLVSWLAYFVSACLWFVYGVRKRDKTIYVACVGWIILDAAIVVGVLVRS